MRYIHLHRIPLVDHAKHELDIFQLFQPGNVLKDINNLRYFKFIGDDRATYIIRQDMDSLDWELTFFQGVGQGNTG